MNNDLISRVALKEAISKVVAEERKEDERWAAGLRYALTLIDNEPTVEARPKGEWVDREYRMYFPRDAEPDYNDDTYDEKTHSVMRTHIVCSNCGAERRFYHNFCGNCGADMRKGGAE